MTKQEISIAVRKVLVDSSNATFDQIKDNDKLKLYVPPVAAFPFALKVDNVFPKVDLTELTNALYDSITKVSDLIDYIDGVYNPTN